MKKKLRFISVCMAVLLVFSLTTVLGTSAAETMAGDVTFTAQASFNKITVNPPQKNGNYYFEICDSELGASVVESLSQLAAGEWVFTDFDETLLFTETTEEYFAFTSDNYDVIRPQREYYIIMYQLDVNDDVVPVINWGVKRVATTEAPEIYKGYEGYMENTLDFEVIPGVDTITLEPIDDGKYYTVSVVELPDGVTLSDYEQVMNTFPVGSYGLTGGFHLQEESVTISAADLEGNLVDLKPNTEYIVTYYMMDSDTFPAYVVTYGAKVVKTVESLSVYDGSDRYIVVMDGDANMDREVNIKDATAIQKHVAKIAVIEDAHGLGAADTTGDGEINVKDATAVQKWIAKLETNTSIGTEIPVLK